ncbi:hypothetical protein Tco_0753738 [Tanacetum coccineum]
MQGADLSLQERHSRRMNEFDKFSAETGFLNSLQSEWSKYVRRARQSHTLNKVEYHLLFDYLTQNEPDVIASKAKRATRNHDPLALVANSYASPSSSRSSQQYYVTHPPLVQDYDDDYQGEIQSDEPEDKLSTAMMLLA